MSLLDTLWKWDWEWSGVGKQKSGRKVSGEKTAIALESQEDQILGRAKVMRHAEFCTGIHFCLQIQCEISSLLIK